LYADVNFNGEMSAAPQPFYPTNNVQMKQQDPALLRHSQSFQVNMHSPQLMDNRTSIAIGNLRKQSSLIGC
jgi:hypothetical protein